jgi:hypothetical protein
MGNSYPKSRLILCQLPPEFERWQYVYSSNAYSTAFNLGFKGVG